jgi:YD repeat-containing protein
MTTFAYDVLGRQISATEAAGTPLQRTTATTYDELDRVVEVLDALDRQTVYDYDDLGRQVSVIEAAGTVLQRQTTFAYDPADRLVSQTRGISETRPNVSRTDYAYDELVRRVAVTEAANVPELARTTRTVYDPADQVIRVIDALNHVTSFAYDALGA